MFRGGDYYDNPKFNDRNQAAKNTLDITVFNFNLFYKRISQELKQNPTILLK